MSTLAQLRLRCQQESDNVGQSFLSDAEWNTHINNSYAELYSLLVEAYGNDYFVASPQSISTDGTNYLFALASDFFKLLGVEVLYGSTARYISLKPFAFSDRNKFSSLNSPIPTSGQTVRVWYIPRVTALSADGTSTVDAITMQGWDEYIVADACIKALAKEESDVSVFMARKSSLGKRLEAEIENRDAGNPACIVDSRGRVAGGMQYRLSGNNIWLTGNAFPLSQLGDPWWDDMVAW